MLRYVWIFVKADFDLNEDLVELIGFQKETGEDVLWQPLWSSDFLMHVLLFGIVCLQVGVRSPFTMNDAHKVDPPESSHLLSMQS